MTGYYGYHSEPEIIWIKDLEQLNQPYKYSHSYIKFVFARFEIHDKTHDKVVKRTASIKKAEEKKARHLLYKKHTKCDVQIVENDLQSKLDLTLENVYGTDASYKKPTLKKRMDDQSYNPTTRDYIIVDRNINMELKVAGIEVDKYLITKTDKQMRLTVLKVEDIVGNSTTITLFDSNIVDQLEENKFVKIKNAEVNMRKRSYSNTTKIDIFPEGLKIPSWASIEPISGFSKPEGISIPVAFVEPQKEEVVRCEQVNCSGRGMDRQYYCTKCDMELCSICIFEHRRDTSISGLECDNEICYGSRKQNVGVC